MSVRRARFLAGRVLASAALAAVVANSASATEGGTTHVVPGAQATLIDLPPATGPGAFVKGMFVNYDASTSAKIPTAAGIVANVSANANTFIIGGGYTFGTKVLGATLTTAAFVPYSFIDVDGNAVAGAGGPTLSRIKSSVDGFGDVTFVPVMLAWKSGNWQYDFILPVYLPTGDYEKGRLGNPSLNYYTFDPVVGVAYANPKSGFNAMVHAGYAMNTENSATDYKSGSMLHVDGTIEQILPVGAGYLALGVEAWYFKQLTGDSGAGATLGKFEGMTTGVGPVLGYIRPMGEREQLVLEAKWLTELDVEKRLEGDYIWLKAVYKW